MGSAVKWNAEGHRVQYVRLLVNIGAPVNANAGEVFKVRQRGKHDRWISVVRPRHGELPFSLSRGEFEDCTQAGEHQ